MLNARTRYVCEMVAQTARLMVGMPDYETTSCIGGPIIRTCR